jgi:hypothetical protein
MGLHSEQLDTVMMQVVEIAGIIDDTKLLQCVSGEIDIIEQSLLSQSQLRWEKHWEGVTDEKKITEVIRHSRIYLQKSLQFAMKITSLSPHEKEDLIRRMRSA